MGLSEELIRPAMRDLEAGVKDRFGGANILVVQYLSRARSQEMFWRSKFWRSAFPTPTASMCFIQTMVLWVGVSLPARARIPLTRVATSASLDRASKYRCALSLERSVLLPSLP